MARCHGLELCAAAHRRRHDPLGKDRAGLLAVWARDTLGLVENHTHRRYYSSRNINSIVDDEYDCGGTLLTLTPEMGSDLRLTDNEALVDRGLETV